MKKTSFILLFLLLLSYAHAYAEDTTYTDEKYNFYITYPSDYRTFENFKGASITVFFPKQGFFDFFNGYVSVIAKSTRPTSRPTGELIDIYFKYDKTVSGKEQVKINDIDFLSVVQTKKMFFFDLKLYILITVKGTKMYTITYINTADNYDKCIDKAKQIMHSFRFLE
ncbi:MAG: hypothetical protein JSW18_03015 [Candidatus Omnitrophota bacterium]|nr:MAG: hypothetical protein JSW18_03015 [Candidatus Omnitrophota bacterium]